MANLLRQVVSTLGCPQYKHNPFRHLNSRFAVSEQAALVDLEDCVVAPHDSRVYTTEH